MAMTELKNQSIAAAHGTPARRRRWSRAQKALVVAETLQAGASVSSVARRHGLNPSQVFCWRKLLRLARKDAGAQPATPSGAPEERLRELGRQLRKTVRDVEILSRELAQLRRGEAPQIPAVGHKDNIR